MPNTPKETRKQTLGDILNPQDKLSWVDKLLGVQPKLPTNEEIEKALGNSSPNTNHNFNETSKALKTVSQAPHNHKKTILKQKPVKAILRPLGKRPNLLGGKPGERMGVRNGLTGASHKNGEEKSLGR